MEERPTLAEIAEHVPYGYECRACGGAVYNHLRRAHWYVESGETCCPEMQLWVLKATEGKTGEPK